MDVIGMDLSAKSAQLCVLDEAGEMVEESSVRATRPGLTRALKSRAPALVVMEVGGTSAWIEDLVKELGHETLVVNPRRVKLIAQSSLKTDRVDAELLARLARADLNLLRPVQHRSEESRRHRGELRVRLTLVEQRKGLINCARGLMRHFGHAVATGSAECFVKRVEKHALPEELLALIQPLLTSIACMDEQIAELERQLEAVAADYEVVQQLRAIDGVGLLVSLSFVLCIDDPTRFKKARDVGPYLGLRPRLWSSGEVSRQGGISKEGDAEMRRLLVQAAHVLLHTCKQDSELRRWGLRLQERQGTKIAVVGVARKLAVLMLHLWQTGASYERLHLQGETAPATDANVVSPTTV
jgi:transposase